MTELTDVLQKHEAGEKYYICFKEFNDFENLKARDHCLYTLILRSNPQQLHPEISNTRLQLHCFSQPKSSRSSSVHQGARKNV